MKSYDATARNAFRARAAKSVSGSGRPKSGGRFRFSRTRALTSDGPCVIRATESGTENSIVRANTFLLLFSFFEEREILLFFHDTKGRFHPSAKKRDESLAIAHLVPVRIAVTYCKIMFFPAYTNCRRLAIVHTRLD